MKNETDKTLVIIGAGGHAKVCYEIAQKMNQWSNFIFLDDNPVNGFFNISGSIQEFHKYSACDFFIAIGSNVKRQQLFHELKEQALTIVTLIHPRAVISKTAKIGEGTVVMAGVVVDADANIGQACILNSGCLIGHDALIENYVHISPGANLAGTVYIGESTWIGVSATVINNIQIGSHIILGAGATAINDLINSGTYIGVPAKEKK